MQSMSSNDLMCFEVFASVKQQGTKRERFSSHFAHNSKGGPVAKNVQDLRKEKGYRSAREFAEAIGIPVSTYARYESQPESIPLKQAWAIADHLGCTIDMVVGRDDSNFTDLRGKVQKFYDELSIPNRRLFHEFMDFMEMREEQAKERRRIETERRYASMARFYEKMFMQAIYEDVDPDAMSVFDTYEEQRDAFRAFLMEKVPERRRSSAEKEARRRVDRNLTISRERAEDMERQFTEPTPEEIEERVASYVEHSLQFEEEREGTTEEVVEKILAAYDKREPVEGEARPGYWYNV